MNMVCFIVVVGLAVSSRNETLKLHFLSVFTIFKNTAQQIEGDITLVKLWGIYPCLYETLSLYFSVNHPFAILT
jgi:hypothetical protein